MTESSVKWQSLIDQVTRHSRLQRGWEVSAGIALLGGVLLICRLLGSFLPDSDPYRAWGLLWLINGATLLLFWGLSRFVAHIPKSAGHLGCWGILQFSGVLALNLALMPLGAPGVVLAVLGSLLLLAGVIMQRSLECRALQAAEESQANPENQPESVASETTPPSDTAGDDQAESPVDCSRAGVPVAATQPAFNQPASKKTGALVVEVEEKSDAKREIQVDSELLQWLTRKRSPTGGELIEGMICLELEPGQSQRSAHVAFAPALPSVPEIECEPLGECSVEASIGACYPHGFRVDVRRTAGTESAERVEIGFLASTPNTESSAA